MTIENIGVIRKNMMSSGFTDKPKILRGAFVEYGLSIPPLVVVFQIKE